MSAQKNSIGVLLPIYIKGILMGMADLVPGVSGGTVALMVGIYTRLINAISAVDLYGLKLLVKGQFRRLWKHVDGWFLLSLFAGVLTAIFTFASLISYLLEVHKVLLFSLFFGLVVGGVFVIIQHISLSAKTLLIYLLLGFVLGFSVANSSGLAVLGGQLGIILSGMIAASAMILPGLSGTLILILLGMYQRILTAVNDKDWLILMLFALGVVIGLMLFSRVLKWLLSHYYKSTLCFLAGLMTGSLIKIWPWQQGINGVNVLPWNHQHPQFLAAVLLMFLGFLIMAKFTKIKN